MNVIVRRYGADVMKKDAIVPVVIVVEVMEKKKIHMLLREQMYSPLVEARRKKKQGNQRLGYGNSLYTKYPVRYLNNSLHTK